MTRVVAYCRVSTDKDEQLSSLDNQKCFFIEHIDRQPLWEYAGIYIDEGISGTSTKKRDGFNKMMKDAKLGLFDLIITKEVSRFARNTVDVLDHTRTLKEMGIGVVFYSDNINTLDSDGELRLSLMATIAQEESRRTSQRVRMGQKRQMEKGIAFGSDTFGYNKKGGILTIDEEEAEIVRWIFNMYCGDGKGLHLISKALEDAGIKTQKGKIHWTNGAISRILKNEKYVGDLIQRKTYTTNHLTHEKKVNKGEVAFIIHRNNHEPLIDRETFDKVQVELARRGEAAKSKARYTNRYTFSGKVKCAHCGRSYVSRNRKGGKQQKLAWKCYSGFKYGRIKENMQGDIIGCNSPSIFDEILQQIFMRVLNDVVEDKEGIINEVEKSVMYAINEATQDSYSHKRIKQEIIKIDERKDKLLDARLEDEITKEEYRVKKAVLDAALERLQAKLDDVMKQEHLVRHQHIFVDQIKKTIRDIISADIFSDETCKGMLEKIVVHSRSEYDVYLRGVHKEHFRYEIPIDRIASFTHNAL